MAFKFLTFAALVAVARAGIIGTPAVTTYAAAPAISAYAAPAYAKVAAPLPTPPPHRKVAVPAVARAVAVDTDFDPNPSAPSLTTSRMPDRRQQRHGPATVVVRARSPGRARRRPHRQCTADPSQFAVVRGAVMGCCRRPRHR
ncbi:Hypothetical predicted protein [Cloeon dipterum]|uniref:Uncharacterized protein n=1 Tax=Cloeon dipterum TaxID=197152 RepID=A0A8S1CPE0_9INSE|nr:Hypothetical predicted protein [Cloeon dipterum]